MKPRTELFRLGVLHQAPSPCGEEHHGCAIVDPDPRYALNLRRVLTTAALSAAKNGAPRSINSPVCECERERERSEQKDRFKAS